jgi:hypothetical protein
MASLARFSREQLAQLDPETLIELVLLLQDQLEELSQPMLHTGLRDRISDLVCQINCRIISQMLPIKSVGLYGHGCGFYRCLADSRNLSSSFQDRQCPND